MSLSEKAERIARSGRVTIIHQDGEHLSANVEGETGFYQVTRDPEGWTCTCPANTLGRKHCSHILASALYERWGEVYEAEARARERFAARSRHN